LGAATKEKLVIKDVAAAALLGLITVFLSLAGVLVVLPLWLWRRLRLAFSK